MVGPGALPLKPHRSKTRPGLTNCLTGSATRRKTFTPLSSVNGKSPTSKVVTGAEPAVSVVVFKGVGGCGGLSGWWCVCWAIKLRPAKRLAESELSFVKKNRRLVLTEFTPFKLANKK